MNQTLVINWKIPAICLSLASFTYASSIGNEHYAYDSSGNMTEKTVNGQTTQMAYSGNRLISKSTGEQTEKIAYDHAGRPITIGDQARNASYGYADRVISTEFAGKNTAFLYNAEGKLVGKSTDEKTTTYTWDGMALAAVDSKVFANEAHPTGGIPLVANGETLVISDYLGTTLQEGENAISCTAFGEGSNVTRFTGKPFIAELDGFIFPARLYSPSFARWTTTDPSGYPDGNNNSIYVSNDPTGNIDATGLLTGAATRRKFTVGPLAGQNMPAYQKSSVNPLGIIEFMWNVEAWDVECDDKTTILGEKAVLGAGNFLVHPNLQPLTQWDRSFNCYAYALGTINYWIEDFAGGIKGDSWQSISEATINMANGKKYLAEYTGHAVKVTGAANGKITSSIGKEGLTIGIKTRGRTIPAYGDPYAFYEK